MSTVRNSNPLNNSKPKAGTTQLSATAFINAIESLKQRNMNVMLELC
jgi:hypothetical protein